MRAGELRHLITIQQPIASQSSSGEETYTWPTYAQVYAAIEPMTMREFYQLDQDTAERTVHFIIRYKAGITAKMRISWDSRLYDIQSIINTKQRNRSMVLIAVERNT